MSGSKRPYVRFFFSDWLAGTRGMKAAETGVYITLLAMMYEGCKPLQNDTKRLARQCQCDTNVFASILKALINQGKILQTPTGLWNKRVQREMDFRQKKTLAAKKSISHRWESVNKNKEPTIRTYNERNTDDIPYHIPYSRGKDVSTSLHRANSTKLEFNERFWPTYPHKVGKPAAMKAYMKARTFTEMQTILDGLERYMIDKPPDISWCNPATFLNQERWNDQPAKRHGVERKPGGKQEQYEAAVIATRGDHD